jgi:hypothetical protein
MSGGSLSYIQYKSIGELMDDCIFDESIAAAAKQLEEYGEVGAAAKDSTETILGLIKDMRERHRHERLQLESCIDPLRNVWRQLDYERSMDVSKNQVREELVNYNKVQETL